MTLPKKGLKAKPYNIGMKKRDLKKLTEGQLIKLLLKQQTQKHEDIIQPPRTGKPKPVPCKSVNKDIILPPPKGFRERPPKPTRAPLYLQTMVSTSTMTYFNPKTRVLESSK